MSAVEVDLPWRTHAACHGIPPETFFPDPTDDLAVAKARSICYQCMVRVPCLEFAQENDIVHGIWGGELLDTTVRRRGRRECTRCGSGELFRWNGMIECIDCGFRWSG